MAALKVNRPVALPLGGAVHVCFVGRGDRGEHGIVVQECGELLVERADLLVADGGQLGERCGGGAHRCRGRGVVGLPDVQQVAGFVHDHQPIAGAELVGKFGRHGGDPIAAEDQPFAGNE